MLTYLLIPALILAQSALQSREITTDSLLLEMVDLAALANPPDPPYLTRQFSSYDRAAKSPEENWFANGDAGKYLRFEKNGDREEAVMMEASGPGAVVRIWSANPGGTMHFYFDGKEQPGFEADLAGLLTGKHEVFPEPFAGLRSNGANLYFPFPYEKSLKITMSGDMDHLRGMYYQVVYRTYEPGTEVRTFTLTQAREALARRRGVGAILADPSRLRPAGETRNLKVSVPAGGSAAFFSENGPGRIMELTLKADAKDLPTALRGCVLVGSFDGNETIWAPLGDFFGSAPGINVFNALPLQMQEDCTMVSRWVMPFTKEALFRVENHTGQPVTVTGQVRVDKSGVVGEHLLFHAKWRTETMHTRPMRDWNFLDVSAGSGVFVGTSLAIANPVRNWWGEGDEKIYLDCETFPSTFGTGTEDYYGYAYCSPALFLHAYHNQPRCDGPGNKGHTSVNRFHIIDAMPFTRSFRFDMEVWHWGEVDVNYAVTAYWYAVAAARDTFRHAAAKDLTIPPIPEPPRVEGAAEGEKMKVLEMTGGATEMQGFDDASGGEHIWWRDAKPGDKLQFALPVPKKGRYALEGRFCLAADYGIHQLRLDGQPCGEPIDFYNPGIRFEKKQLGTFELEAGDAVFEVEVVGANEKAVKRHMFALDYLLLKPVK
jgi:hypothetical protein